MINIYGQKMSLIFSSTVLRHSLLDWVPQLKQD